MADDSAGHPLGPLVRRRRCRVVAAHCLDDQAGRLDETLAGSVGRFADKVPLLALAFPWLPARSIQLYDAAGAPVGSPELAANVVGAPLVTPRAMRWNLQLDQHIASFLFRTRYEERHGHDEFVVNAVPGATVLTSRGSSSERSVEVTTGYQGHAGGNFFTCW